MDVAGARCVNSFVRSCNAVITGVGSVLSICRVKSRCHTSMGTWRLAEPLYSPLATQDRAGAAGPTSWQAASVHGKRAVLTAKRSDKCPDAELDSARGTVISMLRFLILANNNYTVCIKRQRQTVSFCIRGFRLFFRSRIKPCMPTVWPPTFVKRGPVYTGCINRTTAHPWGCGLRGLPCSTHAYKIMVVLTSLWPSNS